MAAGSGSRYGTLKQFDELGPSKEFLFEFSIYDAINNGFNHIVIITRINYVDEIKEYLTTRIPREIKLDVIPQLISNIPKNNSKKINREKPWGTAHAVWVAKNYISNNFVVINADDYYGNDAFNRASSFIDEFKKNNVFGIVPYQLKETLSKFGSVSRGFCQFEDQVLKNIKELKTIERQKGLIRDIETNTKLNGFELVSMNFWICNPTIFSEIEMQLINFLKNKDLTKKDELLIPDVIQTMIDKNSVKVVPTEECSSWFGVTYSNDKEEAVSRLNVLTTDKYYPSPLWKI